MPLSDEDLKKIGELVDTKLETRLEKTVSSLEEKIVDGDKGVAAGISKDLKKIKGTLEELGTKKGDDEGDDNNKKDDKKGDSSDELAILRAELKELTEAKAESDRREKRNKVKESLAKVAATIPNVKTDSMVLDKMVGDLLDEWGDESVIESGGTVYVKVGDGETKKAKTAFEEYLGTPVGQLYLKSSDGKTPSITDTPNDKKGEKQSLDDQLLEATANL